MAQGSSSGSGDDFTMKRHEAALSVAAAIRRANEGVVTVTESHEQQMTQLHVAAMGTEAAAIDVLMSHGADPFAIDVCGWTSLHLAAADRNIDITVVPALMHHMCGWCSCSEQQHPVDPSQINAADCWGRTPLQLSHKNIEPFMEFCERHAEESLVPCVNVVDCEGSTAVTCPDGHVLKTVFQLPLDICHLRVEEENKDNHLTRIQTHVLHQLLSTQGSLIDHSLVKGLEDFVFPSVIQGGAVCSFPYNPQVDSQEMQ